MPDRITLTARWLIPVAQAPIERGILVIEGERIVAVLPANACRADIDFGNAVLTPGFVNAHTHLDLTGALGLTPPSADYLAWLREVIAFRRAQSETAIKTAIADGLDHCVRHGTTLVGDISGDGSSWLPLAASPLRAVVFRELLGLPKDRAERAWQTAQAWLGACESTSRCRRGLSPHAPYSARVSLIKAAAQSGLACALHLAEFSGERELLEENAGPFVAFLQDLGVWDPLGLAKGPEHVLRLLSGTAPALAVHANYLAPSAAIPANVSLVYCPRTQAAFEHPPFPLARWLARDVRIALGTDSLASNPDLSVLEEMRFVRQQHPAVPAATILDLGTLAGAAALGCADDCGSLESGKAADFVVVPVDTDQADPHDLLLVAQSQPLAVWISGCCVWSASTANQ